MREIKFKAYKNNKLVGTFTPLDEDLPHDLPKAVVWCQFTGLLDKAGKEIYEGDIARCHILTEDNHFDKDNYFYEGEVTSEHIGQLKCGSFYWDYVSKPEVIGNIYEHPSLLQEEKGNK